MPLHVGFFPAFKGRDTLLLDGDPDALRRLAEACRHVARGGTAIALHDLPSVEVHHGLRIVATDARRDSGTTMNGVDVRWERSGSEWSDIADKLDALAAVPSGHQYLDAIDDEIQVVASTGEYDDAWWEQNR